MGGEKTRIVNTNSQQKNKDISNIIKNEVFNKEIDKSEEINSDKSRMINDSLIPFKKLNRQLF